MEAATLAGADGYLHKGVEGDKLLEAIQRSHAGECIWLLSIKDEEEADARLRETSEARLTSREKRSSPSSSGAAPTPR